MLHSPQPFDISAKIASLCFQYSVAVKEAKADIQRVQRELGDITGVLEKIQQILDGPNKARLSVSHELFGSLKRYLLELQEIKATLEPGKTRKAMSRLGARALKWPFTNKQIEKVVSGLEQYKQTFTLALQVDHSGHCILS